MKTSGAEAAIFWHESKSHLKEDGGTERKILDFNDTFEMLNEAERAHLQTSQGLQPLMPLLSQSLLGFYPSPDESIPQTDR